MKTKAKQCRKQREVVDDRMDSNIIYNIYYIFNIKRNQKINETPLRQKNNEIKSRNKQ